MQTEAPPAAAEGFKESLGRSVTEQEILAASEGKHEDSDEKFETSNAVEGTSLFSGLCSNALIGPALASEFGYIT